MLSLNHAYGYADEMRRHFYRGSAIWPARVGLIVFLGGAFFAHSPIWRYMGLMLMLVGLVAVSALGIQRHRRREPKASIE